MTNFSRRQFLKGSLAAGAALALPNALSNPKVLGANEDVRLAIIGLGGQGSGHGRRFYGMDGVRIVALAEPDRDRLESAHENAPEADAYVDYRNVLERDDVDAVVLAMPVHWHTPMAVYAMEAGKDVYVEKPFSHSTWESHQLVKAARKHNRICQVGTQQRSDPMQAEIKEFLDESDFGDLQWITIKRFGTRGSIGLREEPMDPPDNVEYDIWLGPAEDQPIYRDELQYDWHWVFNTGAGENGNWGPHVIDDAYNIGLRDYGRLPHRGVSAGGRFLWDDAGNTPNTFISYFDTDVCPLTFEVRNMPETGNYRGVGTGYLLQFENGYYTGRRGAGEAYDADGNEIQSFSGDAGGGHLQNFIDAVREQDRSILNAEVETILPSIQLCHMANIAYRVGELHQGEFTPDELNELASDFEGWSDQVESFFEHLDRNDIDTEAEDVHVTSVVEFDPETGYLAGDSDTEENRVFQRREYREPYVLEEQ
ncbi:MAG: Gfo/Idh/MocA family protein [Candidatus Hydrogenedentota bacterium]